MLQSVINGAASTASSLATSGSAWWQQTACSYSFVQNYIGYCPSICERLFPSALVGVCETALPYVNMIGIDNLVYGTLAVGTLAATTYTAVQTYNRKPIEMTVNQIHVDISPTVLKEISRQLAALQKQFQAFQDKMDSMTTEEKEVEVDLIKRARNALMGYMKQANVSDIFYGDKIREMGLEILERNKLEKPLFKDRKDLGDQEEARLDRVIEAKAQEAKQRHEKKGPAFELHVAKSKEKDALVASSSTDARQDLLAQIQKTPALKSTGKK